MTDKRGLEGYDVSGKVGLEFGPLNRPKVTRDESNIHYIDHTTTDKLREKYAGDPHVDLDQLAHIDIVADGRPLADLTKDIAPFDYVVAAHVMEHVPDLVGWLKDIETVLKPGGVLALWIPDKRFTFDLYRRLSAKQEVAAAYTEKRTRPGRRLIMDHFANVVDVNCWHLWDNYELARNASFVHGPEYLELAHNHYEEGRYIDVHCWVFTPSSFLELMGWMTQEFGLTYNLRWNKLTPPHDLQFFVQLEKSPTGKSETDWTAERDRSLRETVWPQKGIDIAREIGIAT